MRPLQCVLAAWRWQWMLDAQSALCEVRRLVLPSIPAPAAGSAVQSCAMQGAAAPNPAGTAGMLDSQPFLPTTPFGPPLACLPAAPATSLPGMPSCPATALTRAVGEPGSTESILQALRAQLKCVRRQRLLLLVAPTWAVLSGARPDGVAAFAHPPLLIAALRPCPLICSAAVAVLLWSLEKQR